MLNLPNLKINYLRLVWLLLFSLFFLLMLQITLRYIPFNNEVAFLQIKQTEVENVKSYLPIFYLHVYSSIFVLIAGFTQFNKRLTFNNSTLHRTIGYLYAFTVLCFSAPSGIYIAFYANGGITAKIAFLTLGILWFGFTLKAILLAKQGKIVEHQNYMLRSFALASSAISLRFWKVILVYLFHPAPMDVYQLVAWLGWIPNLLIIERIIKNKQKI
jgi:Predicted membrane protein (DUF2306)